MTAWFFATALAKQWDAAIPYLEQKRLNVWTHNKTIQKARESYRITTEQKEYLKRWNACCTRGCTSAQYKNIETEPLKGPKFRKPRTETQKRWNFALCSLRRLLSDLRPKLARAACSNKGLRSDAMLAHKANSNVSAYSVRGFRNFYLIGSVTIIKTVQS